MDRRQSWSKEDNKHEIQGRLMEAAKGQQSGFTETASGG